MKRGNFSIVKIQLRFYTFILSEGKSTESGSRMGREETVVFKPKSRSNKGEPATAITIATSANRTGKSNKNNCIFATKKNK